MTGRVGIDPAPAQLVEERQLVRAIEPQAVDDHQEHAACEPRCMRILDDGIDPRERRLRQLEVEHEPAARARRLHRRQRPDHEQRQGRRDDVAGGRRLHPRV